MFNGFSVGTTATKATKKYFSSRLNEKNFEVKTEIFGRYGHNATTELTEANSIMRRQKWINAWVVRQDRPTTSASRLPKPTEHYMR